MSKRNLLPVLILAFSVLAIPGCTWFNNTKEKAHSATASDEKDSSHNDGSAVLITVNGKPELTAKEFEDFIDQVAEGNPQVKMLMQMMGPEFKQQIYKSRVRSITINEWAKKEGIRNSKDYRDKEKAMINSIRDSLDLEEFVKRHDIEVNDQDAKKYYDENKEQDPRIMVSAAGIKSAGVSFKNQAEANEFADALRKNSSALEKLAKDKKLTVTQFGIVNDESGIDSKVKEKLNATKSFPTVVVVKDEKGRFWVVVAQSKERAQFRTFEQVKDLIKKLLKPKMLEEMLEKEAIKLEKEYNIVHDESYFKEQARKAELDAQEAMKALATQSNNNQRAQEPKELALANAA